MQDPTSLPFFLGNLTSGKSANENEKDTSGAPKPTVRAQRRSLSLPYAKRLHEMLASGIHAKLASQSPDSLNKFTDFVKDAIRKRHTAERCFWYLMCLHRSAKRLQRRFRLHIRNRNRFLLAAQNYWRQKMQNGYVVLPHEMSIEPGEASYVPLWYLLRHQNIDKAQFRHEIIWHLYCEKRKTFHERWAMWVRMRSHTINSQASSQKSAAVTLLEGGDALLGAEPTFKTDFSSFFLVSRASSDEWNGLVIRLRRSENAQFINMNALLSETQEYKRSVALNLLASGEPATPSSGRRTSGILAMAGVGPRRESAHANTGGLKIAGISNVAAAGPAIATGRRASLGGKASVTVVEAAPSGPPPSGRRRSVSMATSSGAPPPPAMVNALDLNALLTENNEPPPVTTSRWGQDLGHSPVLPRAKLDSSRDKTPREKEKEGPISLVQLVDAVLNDEDTAAAAGMVRPSHGSEPSASASPPSAPELQDSAASSDPLALSSSGSVMGSSSLASSQMSGGGASGKVVQGSPVLALNRRRSLTAPAATPLPLNTGVSNKLLSASEHDAATGKPPRSPTALKPIRKSSLAFAKDLIMPASSSSSSSTSSSSSSATGSVSAAAALTQTSVRRPSQLPALPPSNRFQIITPDSFDATNAGAERPFAQPVLMNSLFPKSRSADPEFAGGGGGYSRVNEFNGPSGGGGGASLTVPTANQSMTPPPDPDAQQPPSSPFRTGFTFGDSGPTSPTSPSALLSRENTNSLHGFAPIPQPVSHAAAVPVPSAASLAKPRTSINLGGVRVNAPSPDKRLSARSTSIEGMKGGNAGFSMALKSPPPPRPDQSPSPVPMLVGNTNPVSARRRTSGAPGNPAVTSAAIPAKGQPQSQAGVPPLRRTSVSNNRRPSGIDAELGHTTLTRLVQQQHSIQPQPVASVVMKSLANTTNVGGAGGGAGNSSSRGSARRASIPHPVATTVIDAESGGGAPSSPSKTGFMGMNQWINLRRKSNPDS